MKKMKKFASILLALVMAMALTVPAFAAPGDSATQGTSATTKGTITIANAQDKVTYSVYQLFELESYNTTSKSYSYKILDNWREFADGVGQDYLSVDEQGYVTWNPEKDATKDSADAVAFAKLAREYIASKEISATVVLKAGESPFSPTINVPDVVVNQSESANNGEYVETISNLPLGYYLVDSSTGILCSLDTTDNQVTINEKNDKPSVDKQVQEDSLVNAPGSGWQAGNDAAIGQVVNYKTEITVKSGAQNYVLHDKMSDGLTYNDDVEVYKNEVNDENKLSEGADYVVSKPDGQTFAVDFTDDFEANLPNSGITKLIVTYSATLNNSAVVYPNHNSNKVILNYGDKTDTDWDNPDDETKTYTYEFDLIKTDNVTGARLAGAKFKLYDAKTGGNQIPLVKDEALSSDEEVVYRVVEKVDGLSENAYAEFEVPANGKVVIKGLDGIVVNDETSVGDTYWLEETVAPDGYNKLNERVEVKIICVINDKDGSISTPPALSNTTSTPPASEGGKITWAGCVNVENTTGAQMPETGGIGTTIFYTLGGLMVVAAGVLLVTKRRMQSKG